MARRLRPRSDAVCVTGLPTSPGCPLEASCAYPYLFETAPRDKGGILAGYDGVPNPFVVTPPSEGRCLVRDRGEAGRRGYGPDRGVLDLLAVDSVAPPLPNCPQRVEIALLTTVVQGSMLVVPA